MRKLKSALLYTALALVANAAMAEGPDIAALRSGDMDKLTISDGMTASDVPFQTETGGTAALTDYRGQVIAVNFWATWCVPCREEMPSLAALQDSFAGQDFQVVTIATGRNSPQAVQKFFDEVGVTTLPQHLDNGMGLARSMGVLGLPATILIDKNGNEVGRLLGGADWNSDSARAIIQALIDG